MPRARRHVKGLGVTSRRTHRRSTVTQGRRHGAVPAREGGAAAPGPRRHRPAGGELHGLHAVRPLAARTGASTSRATRRRRRPAVPAASPAPCRRSTASTSTTRCACTAASASRSARSTPCSGAPSTSTPSPASPTCSTTRTKLGEWMETVPGGARARGRRGQEEEVAMLRRRRHIAFGIIAAADGRRARCASSRRNNVVHAALWLVVVLAGAAAQYILLAAEFVAVTQVLVYIGAVMVLFLFGTMLTRAQIGRERDLNNKHWSIAPASSPCCWPAPSATCSSTPSATTSCPRTPCRATDPAASATRIFSTVPAARSGRCRSSCSPP